MKRRFGIVLLVGLMVGLGGCTCRPTDPETLAVYEANNDPFEPTNRVIFDINQTVDKAVLVPVAKGYRAVVPQWIRTGIYNFSLNLRQPVYFVNALLQGEPAQAATITKRFFINTLMGFFGTIDVAGEMDIPAYNNDFGQTLGVWGVPPGPFIMLPILGPSDVRDAVGYGVDTVAAPVNLASNSVWPGLVYSRIAVEGIDTRERALDFLESIEKTSTDFYATLRTMYQQNREKKVNDNRNQPKTDTVEGETKPAYEFDFPEFEDE